MRATDQNPSEKACLKDRQQRAHDIRITEIILSENARITLGLAVKHIARQLLLPEEMIVRKLGGKTYWLEPSGTLFFEIHVPEAGADMRVAIPARHWSVKGNKSSVH